MGDNEEEEGLSGKEEMTTGKGELRDLPESYDPKIQITSFPNMPGRKLFSSQSHDYETIKGNIFVDEGKEQELRKQH
ncbi:hypothetical protein VIGAN_06213600 [Vigna angularis var. angularis]|uniref:Uncharacterized protein n=1 Tax=Vigna angularis var. angularis TaxID=157739 RepID=A0A0S3SDD5_PHAAN|nr:hypothetical protein VIGAN_06213600 [Vigna angularis var. angularis]